MSCPATSSVISWSRSSTSVISRSSVGRTDQHGQRIRARGQVGIGSTLGDLGVEQAIGRLDAPANRAPGPPAAAGRAWRSPATPRPPRVSSLGMIVAQFGQPGGIGRPDHGPQDHLEGDLRHLRCHREIRVDRPTATLSAAISAINPVWRATASRWNGASIRRRRSRCTSSSTTSTEVLPSRPDEHRVRLTRVIHRRIAGEHGLHVGGIVEVDERAEGGDPQREHLAVAAPAGCHEARPVAHHQCRLDCPRQWRSRRQTDLAHDSRICLPQTTPVAS